MKRFGPSQPFQPWERDYGKKFYGGGDIGLAAQATIYAASNVFSWAQALLVPGIQAAANIQLMNRQKADYNQIVATQRQLLGIAVNNYTGAIEALLSGTDFEDAFPTVPLAAEYVPIDACCIQTATIACNTSQVAEAKGYVDLVNYNEQQGQISRLIMFDPRFQVNLDMISVQISDLLRGRLPTSDVVEILSDRAEVDALSGRIGKSRKTTQRDLGLSQARSRSQGRREFHEHVAVINGHISPLTYAARIEGMMQTPAQRIQLALQQAQLVQQSLQNLYNRNAQKDPYKIAELQTRVQMLITKLQFEANKAVLTNTFVPNYAAILQPQISKIAGAIGDAINPASSNHYFGSPFEQKPYTSAGSRETGSRDSAYDGDLSGEAHRPSGSPGGFF